MGKAGRKRKKNVERHECGKIIQEKPNVVAVGARQRIYGIKKDLAASKEGGDAAKRMLIAAEEAREIESAAEYFDAIDEIRMRNPGYRRALLVPSMKSAADLDDGRGHDNGSGTEPGYVTRCKRDVALWLDIERAILQCRDKNGRRDAFAMVAVEQIIFGDRAQADRLGSLINALDAVNQLRHQDQRQPIGAENK